MMEKIKAFIITLYKKIKAFCVKHREILVYLVVGGLTTVVSWAAKFVFNALFIFTSMTFALLFKRRRFVWFIIGLVWVALGTINGAFPAL